MREAFRSAFRDFFNKLFFRKEGRQVPRGLEWQTFPIFCPDHVEDAVRDLKGIGWTIHAVNHGYEYTNILAYRERL